MATKASKARSSFCAEVVDILKKQRPSSLGGAIGITTFISDTLRRGKPFSRKRHLSEPTEKTTHGRKQHKGKGLHVGRRVDQFFREYIESGPYEKTRTTPAVNRRVSLILSALSQRGIKTVAAQVLAIDQSLKLSSYIDAIGVDLKGQIWSIELKCTTNAVAAHEQLYCKIANKSGQNMANGMADTEKHHHYLQSGFGAYALRQTYKAFLSVKPCVIVCCTDGVRFYQVPSHFSNPLAFARNDLPRALRQGVQPKKREPLTRNIVFPWPHDMSGIQPIIKTLGYTNVDRHLRRSKETAYAILRPPGDSPKSVCVAICASRPWARISNTDRHSILKDMAPALRSTHKMYPQAKMLRAVFAPALRGNWEIALIKKALLKSSTL